MPRNPTFQKHHRKLGGRRAAQTLAAAAGSALFGCAVANALIPPSGMSIAENSITGSGTVAVNITWDGSVYSTETIVFDSAINATNGPTLNSPWF